ncbi:unnamed protein product [Periconia digitata]|uniref:Dienelactone hydrolase domain-containing protein n=1 Tax=Periconia digitata TaxID=1303443 RepID=A0A9W4UN98_9PLEO|nr:unnamed protein product [Periconia digitata]
MSSECCKTGFNWTATPTGTETTITASLTTPSSTINTYVTGSSKTAALLMIHDIFGWTFSNLRILADQFAEELGVTVFLPDFFDGEVVDPSTLEDPVKREKFNIPEFIGRNSKEIRFPAMEAVARKLKQDYGKVATIGYCYGAWACLQLSALTTSPTSTSPTPLIAATSIAHPSLLTPAELDAVRSPLQIIAPEHDPAFTPDLKKYANEVVPTLGVAYEYIYFPGLTHGFAAKGDRGDEAQRKGLEKARRDAVGFLGEFL